MSAGRHTPGPWHVREGKYQNVLVEFDTRPDGRATWVLATLDGQQYEERFMKPGTQMANARLIAAAPELLEALEEIEAVWEGEAVLPSGPARHSALRAMHARARAAIAKAKGES
jgi:hypothetical protein